LIFVTFGTDGHPFERALDMIQPLAVTDRIVVQCGATSSRPDWANTDWVEFVQYERQLHLMRTAAAVIAHAGVGSIMSALGVGVRPIVIARRSAMGEHIDDHQLQIAAELEARGLVTPVLDTDELRSALTGGSLTASWVARGQLCSAAVEAVGVVA
jgi:UDP-N-acetylglucosamine transferase subunit ALG13